MGQHRDLKINYDSLKAIQAIVKKYKDALEDLQESTNTFADVIKAQEGDAFKELETEFEEDISVDYSSLISILGDVDTNIGNYMTDMTSYITPEDSSVICRVDRNDIWWNLQQIQGIPYGYLNSYPGVPSHWYMDEWVNPFADDADEVRARNAENQRKRERNYDKLNDFFNNSLKNTAQELWNETESIKSIYDNYVVSYENTDDTYSVKMNSIYYSIASLLDLLKDEVDTRIDFLRGFATGFVDLLKGLKAPLEIALAINPAIPLPPGVRAELLIDGTNEIYQGVKVFINDPENTIGAMFQGMFDTGDEEGTAFCVGYATEKVVEVIVAKKVADAMAGPKVDGKTPFRDLMTPEEAARYDEYWLKVAEKKVVPNAESKAAEILRTQSKREAGPCLSTLYDSELDEMFYGQNFKTSKIGRTEYNNWITNEADPFIRERLFNYEREINSGNIVLEPFVDPRLAGHSEIRALDQAIKARRAAGLPITDDILKSMYVYNINLWDSRKINIMVSKCRCPNCTFLTDGINTLIHN